MPVSFTWTLLGESAPSAATVAVAAELPRDIALDLATGELDLATGGLRLTRGAEAVAQSLYIRLRFFRGECAWDLDAGTPFFESILVKAPRPELIRAALRERILGTEDVTELRSLTLDYDGPARHLSARFAVDTTFGELSAALEATP
jgi:hypothetical protein